MGGEPLLDLVGQPHLALCQVSQRAGEVGSAGDQQEPLPAEHPLWRLENVILTPHVAGYSPRIAERHLGVLLDNIRRFQNGQPLRNVVNKALWF